jgi:hypothetical protein
MKNEQLDQMFETIYGPYTSARCAMQLQDVLDRLIVAVMEYQGAHNPPTCRDLDGALAAASVANQEFCGGDDETVQTEYYTRGLELIKYHQLRREDYFRQQQEQERQEAQKAKAKPKTKKKSKAA